MKVQVLMASMNLKLQEDLPSGLNDLKENNIRCTIINQCPGSMPDFVSNQENVDLFSIDEKGLSKSRNRNLNLLTEKIGLIADQDVRFKKGFQQTIVSAFEASPEADIITFQIEDESGKLLKNYKKEAHWMNQRGIMKVSSIEIAFRKNSIIENGLFFDEDFGLGSTYPTGEEAIFLLDALNKGLKVKYIPNVIVIHPNESSGYQFRKNKTLIRAKGAMFYRMFKQRSYLISIIFAFKKYKISSESLMNFVKLMYEGISSYKRSHYD